MNKNELKKFRDNYTPYTSKCYTDGLELAVHFDEKEEVKRMGAKWQPDTTSGRGGTWWIPIGYLSDAGVIDSLNEKRMIVGPYGKVQQNICNSICNNAGTEYELQDTNDGTRWFFTFYPTERMCYVTSSNSESSLPNVWMTQDQARSQWEAIATSSTCVRNQ